jgi:hypothetical protein
VAPEPEEGHCKQSAANGCHARGSKDCHLLVRADAVHALAGDPRVIVGGDEKPAKAHNQDRKPDDSKNSNSAPRMAL